MKKSENTQATVAFEGFETFFKEDGMFYFRLKDASGEPVLFSKGYSSERSRDNGIQAFRNAAKDGHYESQTTKKGKHYFILKAANHQEIGRSRMFDYKKEADHLVKALKGLEDNVPVFPAEHRQEAPETKPAKREPDPVIAQKEAPAPPPDDAGKMPRYKFSIIYYPNLQIWTLKNDFTGEAQQLKSCDGPAIQNFLLQQTLSEQQQEPTSLSQPPQGTPAGEHPEMPAPAENPVVEQAELRLMTRQGTPAGDTITQDELGRAEVDVKTGKKAQPSFFYVQIVAQSLENRQTTVIGAAGPQHPTDGKFVVPVSSMASLMPGTYLIIARVLQTEAGKETLKYQGSTLKMLQ